MTRLTAQEIIEQNKRIYAENNIKNLDDLNAYTLRMRLENKSPKVVGCLLCGYRTDKEQEIKEFQLNGCECSK
jgi:hypothetical protein